MKRKSDIRTLFRPGDGGRPPYLAGRRKEQQILQHLADFILRREPPPSNAYLYGPRGNGKTVLINRFLVEQRKTRGVIAVKLTPSQARTEKQLAGALCEGIREAAPQSRYDAIREKIASFSMSVAGTGVGLEWAPSTQQTVERILAEVAKTHPFVIAIDEAHTLDRNVGCALLNASQNIRGEEAGHPLLMVFAGTPGLKRRLGEMDASFWSRGKKMAIDRLDWRDPSALTEPLKRHGVSIRDSRLREILADAQGYPFFLQLWGEALVAELPPEWEGRHRIDDIARARRTVDAVRAEYYNERWFEISRSDGLREAAQRLAAGPLRNPGAAPLAEDDMARAIGGRNPLQTLDGLTALGYVWETGQGEYKAGIPSLMRYVDEHAASAELPGNPEAGD